MCLLAAGRILLRVRRSTPGTCFMNRYFSRAAKGMAL